MTAVVFSRRASHSGDVVSAFGSRGATCCDRRDRRGTVERRRRRRRRIAPATGGTRPRNNGDGQGIPRLREARLTQAALGHTRAAGPQGDAALRIAGDRGPL